MSFGNQAPTSLALFCKVVDNYGDIGICWRLARQLTHEHGIAVTLWVDHLPSLQRICPEAAVDAEVQQLAGVTVRHWRGQAMQFEVADIADIVIEFFGCDIPESYIAAMAQREPRPVWLNLEGLSAEEWVEGCHTLPSSHPRLPLTKYFFFPGFTNKTGGLLREASLGEQRRQFQADPAASAAFLAQLGVTAAEMRTLKVSLFCYPHAPVAALFDAWQGGDAALTCLVPAGVAADAVAAFLGAAAVPGAAATRGALTVRAGAVGRQAFRLAYLSARRKPASQKAARVLAALFQRPGKPDCDVLALEWRGGRRPSRLARCLAGVSCGYGKDDIAGGRVGAKNAGKRRFRLQFDCVYRCAAGWNCGKQGIIRGLSESLFD